MITFDNLTLKAFTNEQQAFFTGARINKIQQPTRREFIFTLRNNGETKQFYVNINPQFYHVCFMSKENYGNRNLVIPQKPPMFCMLLRKYLENSRIAKVELPQNERILELYIETYNEIGDKIYLCLAIELMGKHSNVILYNYDTNIILGCAHNVGSEKSREREMAGSLPYVYPPKQSKFDILNYSGEINYEKLADEFFMFSKSFATMCKGKSLETLKSYVRLENLTPCISKDFKYYSLFGSLVSGDIIEYSNVNNMIDDYYSYYIAQDKFKTLKNHYLSLLNQKLKKVSKSISQMNAKILTDSESDRYRLFGDLIMANLYNLKDYSKIASVYDYENDKQISIDLDETKTIKDNANNFYRLYNKAKTSRIKLMELLEANNIKKEYLEQILYSVEMSENISDLLEISTEVEEDKSDLKQAKKKISFDIQTIEPDENTRIYIGKNNKQNDYIISKLASDEDLWFHVHNCAGSHVLLKTQTLTDDLILKCAKLAKEYSTGKNSSKVGVIYTKRKYLRKPPGANLGYVTYKNEKEIIID